LLTSMLLGRVLRKTRPKFFNDFFGGTLSVDYEVYVQVSL
jgi:hypothetical protein